MEVCAFAFSSLQDWLYICICNRPSRHGSSSSSRQVRGPPNRRVSERATVPTLRCLRCSHAATADEAALGMPMLARCKIDPEVGRYRDGGDGEPFFHSSDIRTTPIFAIGFMLKTYVLIRKSVGREENISSGNDMYASRRPLHNTWRALLHDA